ncbi:response regulator [Priestia flexa]|uniref:Response regulator n=1 Tax=Priestia flexa TaxID=86664 RepID=A0A8I1MI24_9BACI|nr:response regulator [Priestia flexa]MBN8252682.1 response regulator [Priestia flexa]MBN8434152.1 response regulator [Priestia flexa]MCA0966685.1 response regulator [Priestia flexa]MCA1201748.1 response regulator [Priestia flexa]MDW8517260.1 response regulator [Priestia flexa]
MRLLLIEDEPDSLIGMKNAIDSLYNVEVELHTSNNAEDAREVIFKHYPELIITDIMLPGISGLDLIEEVVNKDYQPKVIIVSGFDNFEYARRSIHFGAVDYLLKPYSTKEFTEKVDRTLSLIKEEKKQLQYTEQQKSFAEIGTRSMRDNDLVEFCLKRTPLEEHLYHRLCLWNIDWLANKSYSLLIFDVKGYPDGKLYTEENQLKTFAIGNIMQDVIRDHIHSLLFKDPKNRWVLLTTIEDTEEIARSIHKKVKAYQKIELAIGISTKVSSLEEMHAAYSSALKEFQINSLTNSEDYVKSHHLISTDFTTANHLASLVINKDEECIRQVVKVFFQEVILIDGLESRDDITRKTLNYLSQILASISEQTLKELKEIPMSVWEKVDECTTLEEYEKVLSEYLTSVGHAVSTHGTNSIIERAIRIIHSSYMEDLSLQMIADELSLHPVWLSQLFKKETGQTYMDFLTETRINKAKTLLRETSMKVYEIAESVGYQNLQHFGTIFKKRTSQTPKEYRYGK